MKNRIIYTLIVLLVFAGCSWFSPVPKGFPDQKEFAQLLSEIHFTEAVVSQVRTHNRKVNDDAKGYYSDVLQKYDLTQEKFDTIVAWYTSHPQSYQEVYEDVLRILGEKEAKMQNEVEEIKEEMEKQEELRKARNIWNLDKDLIQVSKVDSVNRRVGFDFDVDTIENAGFQLSAFFQFQRGNEIKKASFDVYTLYADSSIDTITYNIPISFNKRKIELDIEPKDTLSILNMKGYLLNHDTSDIVNAKITNIEFVYIPPEDSLENDIE